MDLPIGRKVVVREFGETPLEAVERFLSLEAQPPPEEKSLRPREVVVRIESASVGWVDLLMSSGQYQHMARPPYVPGLEYAGTVACASDEAVRAGAPGAGERVLVDPFLAGPRSMGDYQGAGGFATYAVVPAEAALRVPGKLSLDEACNLLGNYETAYHCLIARGRLRAGETVLINGASGATGMAAVQIAKLTGATVIATGRSEAKLRAVKEQGADHVLVTSDASGAPRGFRDEVKALTGGRGADVIYDAVGGELSLESMRAAAFGARFLIVGWAGTPFVAQGKGKRGAPNANQLPTNLMMMKGLDVLGCPTAISTAHDPSIRAPRLAQILRWAEDGSIRPYISKTYPLESFREAMRAKWNGEIAGGCVLHP